MTSVTKTVRFKSEGATLIEEFLRKNIFLDFSTMTRLAIAHFIENPELEIRSVGVGAKKGSSRFRGTRN
jgi:hypothetical protein